MEILQKVSSQDGISTKYLLKTKDRFIVEATYVKRPGRHTVCISTQIGCVVGCGFCASGIESRFKRSLTSAEIVNECCAIAREVDPAAHSTDHLTFAFMGEGEPFLNFKEMVNALRALAAKEWPIPIRLSASTSGIRPDLIRRLGGIAFPVPFKLQVSLHGPNDATRSRIIRRVKPLRRIVTAVYDYEAACHRPVVWNYVLCNGVNDSTKHARELCELLRPGSHVKFTRLNRFGSSPFHGSPRKRIKQFQEVLERHGIAASYSETDESGIESGCGQLSHRFVPSAVLKLST